MTGTSMTGLVGSLLVRITCRGSGRSARVLPATVIRPNAAIDNATLLTPSPLEQCHAVVPKERLPAEWLPADAATAALYQALP